MHSLARRRFVAFGVSSAFLVSPPPCRAVHAAMGPNDKFDLAHQGRRGARPEPEPARASATSASATASSRRSRPTSRRARAARAGCERQAGDAGADRPARARLSPTARRSASRPTSWSPSRARPPWSRPATPAPTTSPRFRRHIVAQTRTRTVRLRAHRQHRGSPAFRCPSSSTSTTRSVDAAARARGRERRHRASASRCACRENVIARHGLEPLKRAIRACEMAGTGAKVMCHIGGVQTPRADVADPRPAAPGRHPDALLLRRAEHRRRRAPTSCRTASCCRPRSPRSAAAWCSTSATAAAASTTRWPRPRSQQGCAARHDLVRHPRLLGQHAGHAVPALGDEQVPQPGLHARAGGRHGDR